MKSLLVSALFFVTLFACNTASNEFLVKGTLENGAGKTIVLSEYTANDLQTVDSATIDDKGEFKLKGNTSYPKFYMLRTSPTDFVTLVIDSADVIKVSGDYNNLAQTYKIEGSENMDLMKELDESMKAARAKIDSLGQVYRSLDLESGSEEVATKKAELDSAFMKIFREQKEYLKGFIDKNTSSFMSMIALSQQIQPRLPMFNPTEDMEYFEKVDKALYEKYPGSNDVQNLHKYLEQVKNPAPEPQQTASFGIGDQVPDITEKTPEGNEISLSSLRGNYVLLDFWAGWCRPCRMENPNLVKNYEKYHKKGFEIFQVSLDQKREMWLDAIKKDGLGKWKHVSDLGYWQSKHARAYNITSIPANFLLDPEGKVIAVNLRGQKLADKLAEIYGY